MRAHGPHASDDASVQDRLALRDVENYRRLGMTETWLDATTLLLCDSRARRGTNQSSRHWWLIVDGTAVAFLHTMTHDRDDYSHVLCDIEVAEDQRGKGYARRIIEAANKSVGSEAFTTGGFTPLGAQALGWVPVLPWETPGIKYNDQPFVRDWANLIPINPL